MLFTLAVICSICFVLVHALPDAPIIKEIGGDANLQVSKNEAMEIYNEKEVVFYNNADGFNCSGCYYCRDLSEF